ncbi:MAG: hypothetical protein KJN80_09120 [Deltaproteobacteria bacterium]|nr:hypothetical protein [Deltaproteobacteria bacterium]
MKIFPRKSTWLLSTVLALGLFAVAPLKAQDHNTTGAKAGTYLEIGGQTDPTAVGVGLGAFNYNYRYLSTRLALYMLGSESINDVFLGADAGIRLELGTLVSPFIGLGGYYGYHVENTPAEDDNLDNDGDGQVDEAGEEDARIDRSVASIYPEAGLHVWIDKRTRFTLSGKYHITTDGRESDFWLFCVGFSFAVR